MRVLVLDWYPWVLGTLGTAVCGYCSMRILVKKWYPCPYTGYSGTHAPPGPVVDVRCVEHSNTVQGVPVQRERETLKPAGQGVEDPAATGRSTSRMRSLVESQELCSAPAPYTTRTHTTTVDLVRWSLVVLTRF